MCAFVSVCVTGVRNYQIVDSSETTKEKETTLVEIGPRFVLIPIRIFMGSLGGPTLYQNMSYVSPNTERSIAKKAKGYVGVAAAAVVVVLMSNDCDVSDVVCCSNRYAERVQHGLERKQFLAENQMPRDELSSKNVFAEADEDA